MATKANVLIQLLRWYVPQHERWGNYSVHWKRRDLPWWSSIEFVVFFFLYRCLSQSYLVSGHRWIAVEDWLLSTIQGCGSEQPAVHVWVIWFPEIHSNFGGLLLSPTPGQHFSVGQWEQTMTVTKLHQPTYVSNVQNTGRVGKHKGSFVLWWVAVSNLYFCTQMKMLPKNIMEGYGYPLAQK